MKRCRDCKQEKPLTEFSPDKKGVLGVHGYCRACQRPRLRAYYQRNRDKVLARCRRRREGITNESERERYRRWVARNPDKQQARVARYMARKKSAVVDRISADDWRDIKESYIGLCVWCYRADRLLTMDHVDPLSRGGKHEIENVAPACKSCNSAKAAKPLLLYLALRQGRAASQKQAWIQPPGLRMAA